MYLTKKLAANGASRVLRGQVEGLLARSHTVGLSALAPAASTRFALRADNGLETVSLEAIPSWQADVALSDHPASHPSLARARARLCVAFYHCVPGALGWSDDAVDTLRRGVGAPLKILAASAYIAGWLHRQGLPATVVHPGIDEVFLRAPEREAERRHLLLVEGCSDRLYKRVNTAYEWVPPSWPVWGVGRHTHDHPRCDRMHVAADDDELVRLYSTAKVLLKLSSSEGFGLPLLEAMACGSVVLCSDMGGNRDYCRDRVNCLMVEDRNQVAAALAELDAYPEFCSRLASAGRDTARQFTWKRSLDRLLGTFNHEVHSSSLDRQGQGS